MIWFISNARREHSQGRNQSGYTLIELMIGVSITAVILVPLMSWAILVMRQQPVERDGMMRTAQTGLSRWSGLGERDERTMGD